MSDNEEFKDLRYRDIVAECHALADYGDDRSVDEYIDDLAKTFNAMRDHNIALRSENKELKASRTRCVAWLVDWCNNFHFVKTIEGRKELWNAWDSLPDCDLKQECKTIVEGGGNE